jgi:hypothetical protein
MRDFARPWYHGSPLRLEVLRAGSSITQLINLVRAFSHKPALMSVNNETSIKHNGTQPGFLYVVDEVLTPDDVFPLDHPANASQWEWITRHDVRLRLLEETRVRAEDVLSETEIETLLKKQAEKGALSFEEARDDE